MNAINRKKRIKQLLPEGCYVSEVFISKLLDSNKLDYLIEQLDDEIVICNNTSLTKKGYFSSEEQFLNLLDNFIHHLETTFFVLENSFLFAILEEMFESKYCNIFLFKYHWGDNNYLHEYIIGFNKIIINNFVKNLIYLNFEDKISIFRDDNIIISLENIKKILNDESYIDEIIVFLRDILMCNIKNQFQVIYLFMNIEKHIMEFQEKLKKEKKVNDLTLQQNKNCLLHFYRNVWEILYRNYEKKVKYVHLLLKQD